MTLVTAPSAVKPSVQEGLSVLEISTVADLIETLEPLVKTHDVLIHSMAVSDYTPVYMTDFEEVEHADNLAQFLTKQNTQTKISSQADYQVLFLKRRPKLSAWSNSGILP